MTSEQNPTQQHGSRITRPKRRKKFIDPQVQGTLVRSLVVHWLSFFVVAALVTFCLQLYSKPLPSIRESLQQFWWTHGPFFLVMLFLLPVFVLDTIKLSNRFAGPIYRLRFTMRRIAAGHAPPELKFRTFDFWQGLAEDFNCMIDCLKSTAAEKNQPEDAEPVEAS